MMQVFGRMYIMHLHQQPILMRTVSCLTTHVSNLLDQEMKKKLLGQEMKKKLMEQEKKDMQIYKISH